MCRSFLYGNREVPRPASSARNACCSGPHREGEEPKPMMHDRGKSDSAIVAVKPTNNAGEPAAEPVESRAGTKRNAGEQGSDSCDPGARTRTESSSAKEEGEVHSALPPPQRRFTPGGVPRAQARRGPRDGRADVAGLCGRP